MKYVSTRGGAPAVDLSAAILAGLAPDGGLYVPESMPQVDVDAIPMDASAQQIALAVFEAFGAEGAARAAEAAFGIPIELVDVGRGTHVMELYWGPSSAFKDFGAQFLASWFADQHLPEPVTVLVATSGDTGGAVAAAFWRKPNVEVFVLFPKGRISDRQAHQLTCWGDNVHAFAMRADFDACQRIAKQSFGDPFWSEGRHLTSANSINIGRLLPQAAYYAVASLRYAREHGRQPNFVIPTGNLGNALACIWAKEIGFPIGDIVFATNANETLLDYWESGEWEPRASVATLANAMDVGNPSNMERLFHLVPDHAEFGRRFRVFEVGDDTIREVIAAGEERWNRVWDPHTACAIWAREQLEGEDWVVVATAHPAKFETIVEPLVGHTVDVPPALAESLSRPTRVVEIDADADQLKAAAQQARARRP